jgi:hypothetical protein
MIRLRLTVFIWFNGLNLINISLNNHTDHSFLDNYKYNERVQLLFVWNQARPYNQNYGQK